MKMSLICTTDGEEQETMKIHLTLSEEEGIDLLEDLSAIPSPGSSPVTTKLFNFLEGLDRSRSENARQPNPRNG